MRYTDEHNDFLRQTIPGRHVQEIAEAFELRFGIKLTKSQVRGKMRSLGVTSGVTGREKGCETPMSEIYQVGDEMESRGNVWVKVAKGGSTGKSRSLYKSGLWKKKQNLVWERANGMELPEGHVILFADNDRKNFDPHNLVAVPLEVSRMVYGMKVGHYDRASLEACIALARIRIAMNEKRKRR